MPAIEFATLAACGANARRDILRQATFEIASNANHGERRSWCESGFWERPDTRHSN